MATIRRYLFDRDFSVPQDEVLDAASELDLAAEPEVEVVEPEPEPEPTFSREDLEAAQARAFEEGRQQGVREASETLERLTAESAEKLVADIQELFQIQQAANAVLTRDTIEVAIAAIRKLFPAYVERHGAAEIEALVLEILKRIETEPQVRVQIHPSLIDTLAPRLRERAGAFGRRERLAILANPEVAAGDCIIQWTNGGAERLTATTWDQIDSIIARYSGQAATPQPDPGAPVTTTPEAVKAVRAQP